MTRRLLLSYLLVTVIVLAILEIPLAIFYSQLERERFVAKAERDAVVIGAFYEDALDGGDELDPAFATRYAADVEARAVIVNAEGISVIDTSGLPSMRDFSAMAEISEALSGNRSSGYRYSKTMDGEVLYVAVPISSGGEVRGAARITVNSEMVSKRISQFGLGLLAVAVLVILMLTLVGWTIARSVTEPIRRLQTSAIRFGQGEFDLIDPTAQDAPREIVDLTTTMNGMAHRLDELIYSYRAFVADTSHQLRTPLTALRLRLENLEAQPMVEDQRDEIEAAIDEIVRMSALVNDLLRLARTERQPAPAPIDLATMVTDRIDTWRAVAEMVNVSLRLDTPPYPVVALSVPGGIEQVLDNLLDNALHVSRPGTEIRISVIPGETEHWLEVSDDGPGLSDEAKLKATERFWRGDSSRAGTGLGLAIVTSLLEAGNGSLFLEDSHSGGLRVICRLQAATVIHYHDELYYGTPASWVG